MHTAIMGTDVIARGDGSLLLPPLLARRGHSVVLHAAL